MLPLPFQRYRATSCYFSPLVCCILRLIRNILFSVDRVCLIAEHRSKNRCGSTQLTTGRQMAGLVDTNHNEQHPGELSKSSRTPARLFSSTLFCHRFSCTPPKPNPAPPPLLSPSGGLVSNIRGGPRRAAPRMGISRTFVLFPRGRSTPPGK